MWDKGAQFQVSSFKCQIGRMGEGRYGRTVPFVLSVSVVPLAYLIYYFCYEYLRDPSGYIDEWSTLFLTLLAFAFGGAFPAAVLHLFGSPSSDTVLRAGAVSMALFLLILVLLNPLMIGPLFLASPAILAAHLASSLVVHWLLDRA